MHSLLLRQYAEAAAQQKVPSARALSHGAQALPPPRPAPGRMRRLGARAFAGAARRLDRETARRAIA
jgi:hypothetical protein